MSNPLPLSLDDEMRDAVASAFAAGNFFTVAYVDADGWAQVSKRGTVQVLGDDSLALWVRKRNDGLAASIAERPQVTLQYLDLATRGVVYSFFGRARLATDPETTDRVWDASPERERAQDPDRQGAAVVVELERIVAMGMRPEQNFVMQR